MALVQGEQPDRQARHKWGPHHAQQAPLRARRPRRRSAAEWLPRPALALQPRAGDLAQSAAKRQVGGTAAAGVPPHVTATPPRRSGQLGDGSGGSRSAAVLLGRRRDSSPPCASPAAPCLAFPGSRCCSCSQRAFVSPPPPPPARRRLDSGKAKPPFSRTPSLASREKQPSPAALSPWGAPQSPSLRMRATEQTDPPG